MRKKYCHNCCREFVDIYEICFYTFKSETCGYKGDEELCDKSIKKCRELKNFHRFPSQTGRKSLCPHCDSPHWDYSEHLIADANRDMFEDDYPHDDIGDK